MNLYELPALPLSEELTAILAENSGVRIERIVSTGQVSGWYDQTEAEFVLLLQGTAALEYADGEIRTLRAGDTLLIPPHVRHRVAKTSAEPPCIWLCVFWEQDGRDKHDRLHDTGIGGGIAGNHLHHP